MHCAVRYSIYSSVLAALVYSQLTAAQATSTAAVSAETPGVLEEITITAQRRSENLQKAAVALSAVSGDDLLEASVTQPDQLSKLVPALQVQQSGGTGNSIYLRGVGALGTTAFSENAIAVNLDGVFLGRQNGFSGIFYDLERVEVVKGPQGTLYGRNATGGALNVITRKPVLGEIAANLTAEYGNYRSKRVLGGLSVPLGDSVAVRLAGSYVDRDGYLSDGYDDESSYAGRANLLWQPADSWSLLVAADYSHQGGIGPGSVLAPAGGSDGMTPSIEDRIGGSDPLSLAALTARYPALVNSGGILPPKSDGYIDADSWGLSATLETALGEGNVTFIPAYRVTKPAFVFYRPGFYVNQTEDTQQTSAELRYASAEAQRLRYVVGLFYFDQPQDFTNLVYQSNTVGTDLFGTLGVKSEAVFGQATFDVTDRLRLVGGLRYTHEKKDRDIFNRTYAPLNTNLPYTHSVSQRSFENVSYRAGLEFDAAIDSLLYATVASGFKSGGFYAGTGDASFAPEKLLAFTLGSKNRFLSNRIQANLELFYWKYRDQQISYNGPVESQPGLYVNGNLTTNVGQARMYGADAEFRYLVTPVDDLSVNMQYLNAKYTSFVYPAFSGNGQPLPSSCLSTLNNSYTTLAPARVYTLDCSGKSAMNSPQWAWTLGYEHTFALPNDLQLVAGLRSKIETSRYLSVSYLDADYQKSYTMSDASLMLEGVQQRWSVTGYVNNIEDAVVRNQVALRPIANAVYLGLRAPRTYGLRATVRY